MASEIDYVNMRSCSVCGEHKPEFKFSRKSITTNTGTCCSCSNAANRRQRYLHPDKVRYDARVRYWRGKGVLEKDMPDKYECKSRCYPNNPSKESIIKLWLNKEDTIKKYPYLKKYYVELNEHIPKQLINSIDVWYRRICQKCGNTFIGEGKFNRRCRTCKSKENIILELQ